jgi:glycosyltransferase involved in cell wall biosynthesis
VSLRVLCLDIEGGYGGSSRSLYESVRHLPKDVTAEVWCRREGPVQARYNAIGVACRVMPDMPHISALPRLSRNLFVFGRFFLNWPASRSFRRRLVEAAGRFDIIHFNHEGLFVLARWLRNHRESRRPGLTMHVRTHLPSSAFSRWQFRTIAHAVDRLVFITENEKARAEQLAGRKLSGETIYNVVGRPADVTVPHELAGDRRFKVALLGNYAFIRGTDRIVDIAAEIKRRGRADILFVVAGRMTLPRSLPGALGDIARRGGDLAAYAVARNVDDMFCFLGHVPDPEPVLAGCDLVIRPTRQDDPWGRDVLEAMALARPVMSVGRYDRFIETNVSGILYETYDASRWADEILAFAEDRERVVRMGCAAQERVLALCDGPARAADLVRLWEDARCAA